MHEWAEEAEWSRRRISYLKSVKEIKTNSTVNSLSRSYFLFIFIFASKVLKSSRVIIIFLKHTSFKALIIVT